MKPPIGVDRENARERMQALRVDGYTLADRARYYAGKRLREAHPQEFALYQQEFIERETQDGVPI